MRGSLTASFLLHAAILVAALIVLPNAPEHIVPPQDPIPVDIVSVEDFGKRMAMEKADTPEKVEQPKAKPQEVVKDVPPQPKVDEKVVVAPKEAKADPPPDPVEKPEPPKKADEPPPPDQAALNDVLRATEDEEKMKEKLEADALALAKAKAAEEQKQAEEEKKKADEAAKKKAEADAKKKADAEKKKLAEAEAKKKAEADKKKKSEFDPDKVADFLNKIDKESSAPVKPSKETGKPAKGEANMTGDDNSLAATIVDLLVKRFVDCWNIPPSARGSQMNVKVQFQLNEDGSVSAQPRILNSSADPLFAAMAQSVVSAVQGCGPYDFLPKERYDLWQDNTLVFNPSQMFGT